MEHTSGEMQDTPATDTGTLIRPTGTATGTVTAVMDTATLRTRRVTRSRAPRCPLTRRTHTSLRLLLLTATATARTTRPPQPPVSELVVSLCVCRACVAALAVLNIKDSCMDAELPSQNQIASRLVAFVGLTSLPCTLKLLSFFIAQPGSCKHASWEHACSLHYSNTAVSLLV